MFEAISIINKSSKLFNQRTTQKLEDFKNLIESFKIFSSKNNAYETTNLVIHKTRLIDFYRNEGTLESMNRIENIEELLNGVNDFIDQQIEIFEGDNSLSKYLQDVALYSETDKDIHSEKVSLMPIHMKFFTFTKYIYFFKFSTTLLYNRISCLYNLFVSN